MKAAHFWAWQVLIACDQLANAIIPGGWADETFSCRCWRLRHKRGWGAACRLVDGLFRLGGQRDHCWRAFSSEMERRHLPPMLRKRKEVRSV